MLTYGAQVLTLSAHALLVPCAQSIHPWDTQPSRSGGRCILLASMGCKTVCVVLKTRAAATCTALMLLPVVVHNGSACTRGGQSDV